MEAIVDEIATEVSEPKKGGRGNYERKRRGSYKDITQKKITVQHYWNTKIDFWKSKKSKRGKKIHQIEQQEHTSLHPIYVRISFNGKMTSIRSVTEESFSNIEEYEKFMREDSSLPRALEREAHFIEEYIRASVTEHQNVNKEVSDIIKYFDYTRYYIDSLVNAALITEITELAKQILPNDNPNKDVGYMGICNDSAEINRLYQILDSAALFTDNLTPSALELLIFSEKFDIRFKELRNIFSSDIWVFKCYKKILPYTDTNNEGYANTYPNMLDYTKGKFKEVFRICNKERLEEVEKIIVDIDKLLDRGTLKTFRYY